MTVRGKLPNQKNICNRWREHIHELLNRSSIDDNSFVDHLNQLPIMNELDSHSNLHGVSRDVAKINIVKPPGLDGIITKLIKCDGPGLNEFLHGVFLFVWAEGALQD